MLITGATRGVGDFAIQLGKLAGARAIAHVRRSEQASQVMEAGADQAAVGESLAQAAKDYGPYALIIGSVGGQVLGDALGIVTEGTKIVSIGTSAGDSVTFDVDTLYGAWLIALYGSLLFDELRTIEAATPGLKRLTDLVAAGKLTPNTSVERPWREIATVAQDLADRKYPGKAVLLLGEEH